MADIFLLGPQNPVPNIRAALDALGIAGRLCVVSAGWQEREGELEALREQLANPVTDLAVYARCEQVFSEDQMLFAVHRERQDTLIAMQRLYRLRLSHTLAAAHELAATSAPGALLEVERRAANSALRSLDRHHLRQIRRVHADFQTRNPLACCHALRRHRAAIAAEIDACDAVLIAGGHVAVLLGRLRLLDFAGLIADKTVIAWSAGAMAITDRVVLFHDYPPQGAGDPELLDAGLGLVPGIIALPSARERLALDDTRRVGIFARRFAPTRSLTFDNGSLLHCGAGRILRANHVSRLTGAGSLVAAHAS
jgi:hypothetical protein